MDLTITLSASEVASLESRREEGDKDLGDVIHRLLAPTVKKDSDVRLNSLADQYRALSPDDQVEALGVLRAWYATKRPTP